jgi:hypothetical protein
MSAMSKDEINVSLFDEVKQLREQIKIKGERIGELEDLCELSAHENADKDRRIADLENQLKPRLFWDASDTEVSHDSIEELIHLRYEDGAKVGDEIEIQRGVLLSNETYVITKIDDEEYSCEYELKGGAE